MTLNYHCSWYKVSLLACLSCHPLRTNNTNSSKATLTSSDSLFLWLPLFLDINQVVKTSLFCEVLCKFGSWLLERLSPWAWYSSHFYHFYISNSTDFTYSYSYRVGVKPLMHLHKSGDWLLHFYSQPLDLNVWDLEKDIPSGNPGIEN